MKHNRIATAILVIDDDPLIRDMMVDLLEPEGYHIETARNGYDALAYLNLPERYLIFLDLMMPIMDGYAFCQYLDAHPAQRQQHTIVLMTALNRLREARSLSVDATMPKPFTIEDILHIMHDYYPL